MRITEIETKQVETGIEFHYKLDEIPNVIFVSSSFLSKHPVIALQKSLEMLAGQIKAVEEQNGLT